MRVLTFTSLYPNSQQTRHGVFVENRMRHFKEKFSEVELTVIAPVPWFPFKGEQFGKYGEFARVPKEEVRHGIKIYHPRYLVLPKIGMNLAVFFMAFSMWFFFRRFLKEQGRYDVLDAHFYYPDGVVAAWLAKRFDLPVACTARGNDTYLYPNHWLPRKLIRWALRNTHQPIAVCKALADEMQRIEPTMQQTAVCRNGVDLKAFYPVVHRDKLRAAKQLKDKFVLLCVGHLIERKGQYLVLEALKALPDCHLLLAGDGPMETELRTLAKEFGVEQQVSFLGHVEHKNLIDIYNIADCMVLASSKEGWANVLLESMACGTPVVATAIWGTPEVVASSDAGQLVEQRTADGIAQGVKSLQVSYPGREKVRRYAEAFSWDETSMALMNIFSSLSNASAKGSVS